MAYFSGGAILVWLLFVIGWIANIVQVAVGLMALETISTMSGFMILKIISVFIAPVGAVLGWVGMF